jgi:hypothetical protein
MTEVVKALWARPCLCGPSLQGAAVAGGHVGPWVSSWTRRLGLADIAVLRGQRRAGRAYCRTNPSPPRSPTPTPLPYEVTKMLTTALTNAKPQVKPGAVASTSGDRNS